MKKLLLTITMLAMALTAQAGQGQVLGEGGTKENPVVQRTLRLSVASTADGTCKSFYSACQIRSEGENHDKLVIHVPQMNAQIADDFIRSLREESNFWNALRVVGFGELILRGSNYRRSISRKDFIPWCRNYEKFLAEAQRAKGQILRGL
jgi:hypothetical protein